MNDPQQTISWRRSDSQDRLPAYEDAVGFEDPPSPADATTGLVNFGFIGSALGRGKRVWCTVAAAGLLIGCGLAVAMPPGHSATTTVLVNNPGDSLGSVLQTDIALAESTPVAAAVVAQLGIQQAPTSFRTMYNVVSVTTQVLSITANGPTDVAAVNRASAIAEEFLAFRAKYLQKQLQDTEGALTQQVSQAQQNLDSINNQISQVSAEPSSATQKAQLGTLRVKQTDAENTLSSVKQYAASTALQAQTTTMQMVRDSQVLSSATAAKRSVKKAVALYAFGGLVGGLLIGVAFVAIAAITSDRLRRRDDIAYAFRAPVRLSLGRLRKGRWSVDPRGRAAALRKRDMERFTSYLRNAVPARSGGAAGLAVVPVDDMPTVARAVVELAISSAEQRKRVIVADLSAGALAARQLGVSAPGVTSVSPGGKPIVVMVPDADEVAPVGPLRPPAAAHSKKVNEQLADACSQADFVLSLVTLNPAFGGDYLGTWATDAVAVVTAGKSTVTQIQAAGEMIRLAGVQLSSVVVVDADKTDETLGVAPREHRSVSSPGA